MKPLTISAQGWEELVNVVTKARPTSRTPKALLITFAELCALRAAYADAVMALDAIEKAAAELCGGGQSSGAERKAFALWDGVERKQLADGRAVLATPAARSVLEQEGK